MAQGISVAASLALAVKLKRMFEGEDRYLSFPIGLGFPENYFDFMKAPEESSLSAVEQANHKGDFARQMNLIPDDRPLFSPDGSALLWDRLEDILRECEFAETALSEAEEARLAEAIDYLTDDVIGDDGVAVTVMSPQLRTYYEYRTIYEQAESAYRDEKLSVEFASGPEGERLRRAWMEYREAELLGACEKAKQDWIEIGHRAEVEHQRAVQSALEVRKYLELYRQAYLNEMRISEVSDVAGQGIPYLNTFFSPVDAFEHDKTWASITLTRAEMAGLIREAPSDLRGMFGDVNEPDPNLEAIKLEYTKVVVIRPWYRGEFFNSRHWRLPDGRLLCDGGSPRSGPLPAVITSMVVARNVHMVRRKDTPPSQTAPGTPDMPLQIFIRDHRTGGIGRTAMGRVRDHRSTGPSGPAVRVRDRRPEPVAVRVRDYRRRVVQAVGQEATVSPAAAVAARPSAALLSAILQPRIAAKPAMLQARSSFVHPAAFAKMAATPSVPPTPARRSYDQVKLHGLTIRAPISTTFPATRLDERLKSDTAATESETIKLDGFSVLALACRRLPRCPNPDETLRWA